MVQLGDLHDDCLIEVLDQLSPPQLVKTLGLNKRLNRLASGILKVKIEAITFTTKAPLFPNCTYHGVISSAGPHQTLVLESMFNDYKCFHDPSKRYILFNLLAKCSSVKTIDFGSFEYPGNGNDLFQLCPQLDRIKLDAVAFFRYDRLTSFLWYGLRPEITSSGYYFNFANLKTFEFDSPHLMYSRPSIECLLASQFPRLEELRFDASRGFTESDFELLFQKMPSLKKLALTCGEGCTMEAPPTLPGAAIRHLKNLECINLLICRVWKQWQPKHFLKQLEQYVDVIQSLKQLNVGKKSCCVFDQVKTVAGEVQRLKLKQNRVRVVWRDNYACF